MSNVEANLAHAQSVAEEQFMTSFDHKRGFPMREPSDFPDFWPGDRWPEAFIAIGEPELALRSFNTMLSSRRKDGAVPHLLSGAHYHFGSPISLSAVDRFVYIVQGNGLTRNAAKNAWVTKNHAHPSWAIGGQALLEYKQATESPADAADFAAEVTPALVSATDALYKARGNRNAVIINPHQDEMTNSAGKLGRAAREGTPQFDPAINASLVLNNNSVTNVAAAAGHPVSDGFRERSAQTEAMVHEAISYKLNLTGGPDPEVILAAARLGRNDDIKDKLDDMYAPIAEDEKHPEDTRLSAAECLEIARLTIEHAASKEYIERAVAKIAETGQITRFEGIAPGNNPIGNKIGRKQIWLPTAAQIVQVDPVKLTT